MASIIDNTAQVYGQALNKNVQTVHVTNMGVAYSNQPVVFGVAATLWVSGATAGSTGTRVYSGNNVYTIVAGGATAFGTTAPTHNGTQNGSVNTALNGATCKLLWIGTLGTIGTPLLHTALSTNTAYFYGPNLYVMTSASGTIISCNVPTHTSGSAVSGTATLLYIGSAAIVSLNYDATTQTVRSLTLTNPGSGYIATAPSIAFSLNGGTVTTAAVASATIYQQIIGAAGFLTVKSGQATFTNGLTIKSDQAVGAVTTTNGGSGYATPPAVGFALPTGFLNLVTSGGAGYTSTPTIAVSGGTQLSGGSNPTFTVTVASGKGSFCYL